jgi:hypothetical protein
LIRMMYGDMVPAGGKYGTALQAAASRQEPKIIALLLESGADPNAEGVDVFRFRRCPLTEDFRGHVRHSTPGRGV